jgi:predicted transposase YbfD/YdcC
MTQRQLASAVQTRDDGLLLTMSQISLLDRIMQLKDPRQSAKCTHNLGEVVFMTTCALLCGADDWNAIHLFASEREEWFRKFLKLPGGIPSHDTFNRLFSLLDPAQFRELFIRWVQDVLIDTPLSGVVAIDGKTVRGSRSRQNGAIHMVNAWASDAGISLGQYKVDDKTNEITAIPELLELLALKGCRVTLDAMGCQKRIASKIIKQNADYLLAVKSNQKKLHSEISAYFSQYWEAHPDDAPSACYSAQDNQAHGRQEHRRCWVMREMKDLPIASTWQAKTIAAVQLDRQTQQKGASLVRYFISSKKLNAEEVLQATRQHWHVENRLHWVLDVAFSEDQSRARQGYAAENLATARQLVLNLLKQDTTVKVGIKNKRKACGWSDRYLFHILGLVK